MQDRLREGQSVSHIYQDRAEYCEILCRLQTKHAGTEKAILHAEGMSGCKSDTGHTHAMHHSLPTMEETSIEPCFASPCCMMHETDAPADKCPPVDCHTGQLPPHSGAGGAQASCSCSRCTTAVRSGRPGSQSLPLLPVARQRAAPE